MRVAVAQLCSGIDPTCNAALIEAVIARAAAEGAAILFTPEMSNLVDRDRARAASRVVSEADDPVVARACAAAARAGLWVQLGSVAVTSEIDGRFANRSLLIGPGGLIAARYDKMHLFDVDLADGTSWRESASYRPGVRAAVADAAGWMLGLSICYDVRFPALYQALSGAGATILAVPAAFTVPTGEAHWHLLLRARAVENGCWVVAAAQAGLHEDGRRTFGHSLVVDPWGQVCLDLGGEAGFGICEVDPAAVDRARTAVPVLRHRRAIPPVPTVDPRAPVPLTEPPRPR